MKIEVDIEPKAQKRPRVTRYGTYDGSKEDKEAFLALVRKELDPEFKLYECAINVELVFTMPIPKTTSKKRKKEMIDNTIKHTKRPDCDNLAKLVLDAMNGVVYTDDSLIVKLTVSKFYGETPSIIVIINEDR